MNAAVKAVIKAALYKQETGPVNLTKEDFEELKAQTLVFLTADIPEISCEDSLRSEMLKYTAKQMQKFSRYMKAQDDLTSLLTWDRIKPVIIKGTAAAMHYPSPGLRAMGDIDFLLYPNNEETFQKAQEILLAHGYEVRDKAEDSERHAAFTKDGISFEMHRRFALGEAKEELEAEQMIADAEPERRMLECYGSHRLYTLPDAENGIVLLEHIAHHLFSGLGLRQITDWLMYTKAVMTDKFFEEKFRPLAERAGLLTLAEVVTRCGELYFGAPKREWCKNADEAVCTDLMELAARSGNFGRNRKQSDVAATTVMNRRLSLSVLQKRGLKNWKAAQKHAVLRPFAWLYQSGRYIKKGISRRKDNSEGILQNYRDHKKQSKLIAKLGLRSRR